MFKSVTVSSIVFLAMSYLEQFKPSFILLCIALSLIPGSFYYIFSRALYREREMQDAASDFRSFLYALLSYKSRGIPVIKAAENYSASSEKAKEAISEIRRRVHLGEAFGEAAEHALKKSQIPVDVSFIDTKHEYQSIEKILRNEESSLNEKSVAHAGLIQRDATINMFMSTIAPSFIIFIFTGSMILSRSFISLMLFSIVMLVVLPTVNIPLTSVLFRRSYA